MSTPKHRCAMCGCYVKRKPQLPLTRRQRQVYEWCAAFEQAYHIFPTFAEIGAQFGWRSPATVHECVTRLVRKGWFVKVGSRLDRRPYATRVTAWGSQRPDSAVAV